MTKPEGREKTYPNIYHSHEAIPPRTLDPLSNRKKGTRNIPEKHHQRRAVGWTETQKQEWRQLRRSDGINPPDHAEMFIKFSDNFGASY